MGYSFVMVRCSETELKKARKDWRLLKELAEKYQLSPDENGLQNIDIRPSDADKLHTILVPEAENHLIGTITPQDWFCQAIYGIQIITTKYSTGYGTARLNDEQLVINLASKLCSITTENFWQLANHSSYDKKNQHELLEVFIKIQKFYKQAAATMQVILCTPVG